MELYLIRHAEAGRPDAGRWPGDRARPLTAEGVVRFEQAAAGLARLAPRVDLVLASPVARAWQTAEILRQTAGWPEPEPCGQLEPGNEPHAALESIEARIGAARLAVVGHEPTLSALAALLLAGEDVDLGLTFQPGGVACLRIDGDPEPASAQLVWWLTADVLRQLGSAQ